MIHPDQLFAAVVGAVDHDPISEKGRGFGSDALEVGGKIFAMVSNGELVVKLPRHRVARIADASGTRFDPGHGRLMKEWVAVPPGDAERWIALAREARAFVEPRRG